MPPNTQNEKGKGWDQSAGAHLLLVDDNDALLAGFEKSLARDGFRISVARSGTDALAQVKTQPPDLILLDISMPEPNGYEVSRLLKQNPLYAEIPIIFLSVRGGVAIDPTTSNWYAARAQAQRLAARVGGAAFFSKPVRSAELRQTIKCLLYLRRHGRSSGRLDPRIQAPIVL
jgi:CheY-like chemotaxis protein